MAFAVPNIPSFSFSSWGTGGVARNLTPVQAGGTSRIGGAVGAWPPAGVEATFTAWGFMAGTAPPGATTLAVTASGFGTIERGVAETFAGYARAYGDIAVTVEEFEPLKPVHSGLGDLLDDGDGGSTADIGPGATAVLGTVVFKRSVTSVPTIIINQETTVLGFQAYVGDGTSHLTTLVMPITGERLSVVDHLPAKLHLPGGVRAGGGGLQHRVRLRAGVLRFHPVAVFVESLDGVIP